MSNSQKRIETQVLVAAPIQSVWETWTTEAGIRSFFAPSCRVEARSGGLFEMHFMEDAPQGMRGSDDCVFLALQAPSFFSFTWNAPPSIPMVRAQRTFVAIRLAEEGGKTRVTLVNDGYGNGGEWDEAFAYFERAWGVVLQRLQQRFESGPLDWERI